jgi:hypothetical protein
MDIIFAPLKAVAKIGIELTSADGAVRQGHPILASYPVDYLEQSLVMCTRYNVTCPKCNIKVDGFGNGKLGTPREQNDSLQKIKSTANETSMMKTNTKLKRDGLKYIPEPFWADWYLVYIHSAITPDILHQLYQGIVKHLIGWLRNLIGDNWMHCLNDFHQLMVCSTLKLVFLASPRCWDLSTRTSVKSSLVVFWVCPLYLWELFAQAVHF